MRTAQLVAQRELVLCGMKELMMKICEMMDVKAWAELMKVVQKARVKPKAAHKAKPKAPAKPKLTDFERNTSRLRGEVARLKARSPIPPVSLRTAP